MKYVKRTTIAAIAIVGFASVAAAGTTGPDVIVGDLPNISNYSTVGDTKAYAVGTTSCNIGDEPLLWISGNNQHPVIGQNLYRYHEGVMMQVGQSWLKHGFFALSGSLCGSCQGTSGSSLGVGCSDPYSSGLNGSQSGLGPRFEVNAYTGVFPYPFSNPNGSSGDSVFKRLQVKLDDVLPSDVPGARFFVEGHYVTADDAQAGNGLNNASYREVTIGSTGNMSIMPGSQTERTKPAIMAWADIDPDATVVPVDVPNEGRFHVGSKVVDNGDGTWTYHYAVHNLNSDRSARLFRVPVPSGVNVIGTSFNDVFYHSGEPFDGTDWTASEFNNRLIWSTDTFAANEMANAIRWGTMYNFSFTADSAPEMSQATIGLFKPGTPASVGVEVPAPMGVEFCAGDCDGNGSVNFNDLTSMLFAFGNTGDNPGCDANGDGSVNFNDLTAALFLFGDCP